MQMQEQQREDLRARFIAEMAEAGLSQAKIARELGTNASYVNTYLKDGTVTGSLDEFIAKITRWVTTREAQRAMEAQLPGTDACIPTPTARRVIAALTYAQAAHSLAVVYGGAGLGKTTAALHYAGHASNVWVATMTPCSRKVGGMLKSLCRALGLKPASIWPTDVEAQIIERLQDTRGLLIVDEAQHLTIEALETVRSIFDASGVGLALLGNERLYTQMVGARTANFAQFFSRISKRVRLGAADPGDADALLDGWKAPVSADGRRRLLAISQKDGGLRQMVQALKLATITAAGEKVTGTQVNDAYHELGGDA